MLSPGFWIREALAVLEGQVGPEGPRLLQGWLEVLVAPGVPVAQGNQVSQSQEAQAGQEHLGVLGAQ